VGFAVVSGTLFFAANDGTNGSQLWKSDGTASGTVRVTSINTGGGGISVSAAHAIGSTYYFSGSDATYGVELWKSDGTASGTVLDAILAADEVLKEGHTVRVLNAACIRPIDASAVIQAALETTHIIVVEDHSSEGGLATQIADIIADFQLPCSLRRMGVNHYFPSGTDKDLKFLAGLDAESIAEAIRDEVTHEVSGGEDAFVTSMYSLGNNAQRSRFRNSIVRFVQRAKTEKNYLESLRTMWQGRNVPPEKLPSTKSLLEKLAEETID
jgi:ELWxxDGT repeat protein